MTTLFAIGLLVAFGHHPMWAAVIFILAVAEANS